MSFKLLASIRFLSFQDLDVITTPLFKISKHQSIKNEIIDKDFEGFVGLRSFRSFQNNALAYTETYDDKDDDAFLHKMGNEFYQTVLQIETFLLFLWFVKDNSVSLEQAYGQFTIAKKFDWWTGNNIFSDCEGRYKETSFSVEEVKQATSLLLAFTKEVSVRKSIKPVTKPVFEFSPGIDPLLEQNRIERALSFLSTARAVPHLPQKITHYMSILECLFSKSSKRIVYNVSGKAANYIGDMTAIKIITDAYDIRSRFVHGEKVKKTHSLITKTAKQTDNIIRQVLKKIISSDYQRFA